MQTPCLLIHPLGACVSPAWLTQGVMFSWRPASRLTPTVFSPPLLQGSLISEGRDPMETSNLHTFLSIMLGCEYLDPRPSAVRQERFYLTVVWILTKPYTEVDNECCVKNSPRLDQQHSNSHIPYILISQWIFSILPQGWISSSVHSMRGKDHMFTWFW